MGRLSEDTVEGVHRDVSMRRAQSWRAKMPYVSASVSLDRNLAWMDSLVGDDEGYQQVFLSEWGRCTRILRPPGMCRAMGTRLNIKQKIFRNRFYRLLEH
eukprot:10209544-Alexandrium_andersonii.AAC.1